jgi:hypothetical protein
MVLKQGELRAPDNPAYSFLMDAGVLHILPSWQSDHGIEVVITVSLLRLGDAQFITAANSASSQLAAAYACAAVQLLTEKPADQSPCEDLAVKIATK